MTVELENVPKRIRDRLPSVDAMGIRSLAERIEEKASIAGLATGDVTVGSLSPSGVATIPASTSFVPFHPIWLFELTCDAAGSATVTLSGVRRDDASTEVIATYNLIASQTLVDANDRTDHSSFSWTKTGTGAVTARVL